MKTTIFFSQANEFFLFAGLMLVDMIIFATMAMYYKYVELNRGSDDIVLDSHRGTSNLSYKEDD